MATRKIDPAEEHEVQQHLRCCKHFNGVQHERCEAGVKYENVRVAGGQGTTILPCIKPTRQNLAQGVVDCDTCSKREWPDETEVRKKVREYLEQARLCMEVAEMIRTQTKKRQGVLLCPKCGERKLAYSIAHNGHAAAKCSNGCVSFME